jgi:hypothetical protein
MQYIKISDSLKPVQTFQTVVFLTVVFFEMAISSTQLDIRAGAVSGEIEPDSGIYAGGLTIQEIYNGSYALSPKLELMLESRFDGLKSLYWDTNNKKAMQNYPLKEKLLPSSNLASAGLRWTGLGDAQVTLRNVLYLNSLSISPYYNDYMDTVEMDPNYFPSPDEMSRDARTYANVYWSLPLGRVTFTADLYFIILKYLKTSYGYDIDLSESVQVGKRTLNEKDLWSDYSISCRLFKDVYVKIDASLKQNLSSNDFLNMYCYKVELSGNHKFPEKNQITWIGGVEQYQRPDREELSKRYRQESDGFPMALTPLFYAYFRDVLTISRGLFLKGTAIFETGNDLLKQRYEISLRKAWRNRSYIEPGYCTSLSGLFPIQSAYVKSCVQVTDAFGITPAIKFSWNAEKKETVKDTVMEISFLKTLASLELSYAIKKHMGILLGGNFTYFNKEVAPGFPNRFGVYCGIQGMIP